MIEKRTFAPLKRSAILSGALLLAGCGPRICEGEIISKYYEPERHYTTFMLVGKVTVPQRHTDDEDYVITFESLQDGETVSRSVEIEASAWEQLAVGDHVSFCSEGNER